MGLPLSVLEFKDAIPILAKLPIGICLADAVHGRILFANEEFAQIVGRSTDEINGRQLSFLDLTHPADRESNRLLQRKLLSGELDRYELEKRYLRPDGSIVWASVKVDVVDRSYGVTRSIGLVEDISARKILEQQMDAAQNAAALTTWNWSVKSDTSTTSSNYNVLRGLPEATRGPSFREAMDRVHPDDRNALQAAVKRALVTKSGYTEEYRIVLADGRIRWMRSTANCVTNADGEVINLIGATFDITQARGQDVPKGVSKSLQNVLTHMTENWSEPLSLKQIGKLYGVSARSIHAHFASQGRTPNKFIKKIRLHQARQRLLNGDARTTVTAVALQCGFSNLGHFAKDYRNEYGEVPSETMRMHV